jgi:PPOX class probable F420-dependent enzyme
MERRSHGDPDDRAPGQRPPVDLEARFRGRYLSVTSFTRDGTGVATPLWFVSDGRRLFALTDLHSAKVRRMRRNPRVWSRPAVQTASCAAPRSRRARKC